MYLLWNCPHMSVTTPYYDKSTLVQVMAWCHQATSHYLNQCWPISLPPYDVTRPQWVNPLSNWLYSYHLIEIGYITNTNQIKTKLCAYFVGYAIPPKLPWRRWPELAKSTYKWALVSHSGVAVFHLVACHGTSVGHKVLVRHVCSLHYFVNSFQIRLMLH